MKIIKGNLITMALVGQFDLIGHGCSCQNVMGAGIAKQIKEVFPDAFLIDKEYYSTFTHKVEMMGTFSRFWYSDEKEGGIRCDILNMYTQLFPGLPSPGCKIPFDYEAFTVICRKVNQMFRGKHIGLPWIGCGLGGAYEPMVATIINDNLNEMEVTIVEYEDGKGFKDRISARRLGENIITGEGFNPSAEVRGRDQFVERDTRGGEEYRRGAPIKLGNHQNATQEAAGRSYWIGGEGEKEDPLSFDRDNGSARFGAFGEQYTEDGL